MEDYQRFVFDKLSKLAGIANYRSTLIMRMVKHTTLQSDTQAPQVANCHFVSAIGGKADITI